VSPAPDKVVPTLRGVVDMRTYQASGSDLPSLWETGSLSKGRAWLSDASSRWHTAERFTQEGPRFRPALNKSGRRQRAAEMQCTEIGMHALAIGGARVPFENFGRAVDGEPASPP